MNEDDFEEFEEFPVENQKNVDFSRIMLEEDEDEEEKLQQQSTTTNGGGGLSASIDRFNTTIDINTNRPAYETIDSVKYYEIGAMFTLIYAHVTEGIGVPCLFNNENQSL